MTAKLLGRFLQEGDSTEGSSEIVGILEQMKSDMTADLKAMCINY
jgi:hypothetical protein